MESTSLKGKKFVGEKISIHFIYTFLFSKLPIEASIRNSEEEKELTAFIEASVREKAWKRVKAKIHLTGEEIVSETHKDAYLEPYLHLKIPRMEVNMECLNNGQISLLEWNGDKYVKRCAETFLMGNILVLASGQGALVYILEFEPDEGSSFDKKAIVNLSNIGMRKQRYKDKDELNREFSKFRLAYNNGEEVFLFSRFFRDISNLKKLLQEKYGENQISWIETSKELKLVGDVEKYKHNIHFQDPFPLIVLTVADEIFGISFLDLEQFRSYFDSQKDVTLKAEAFGKQRNILQRIYHKDLLTILSRSRASDFASSSFIGRFGYFSEGKLVNMCSTSSVFVHLYSRSGLAVEGRGLKSQQHASYIIPAFIETVEYLRIRWHTCVVSIQWLNKVIEKLSEQEILFEEALQMIISSRREIARALCDPVAFRLGSGSMNKIYEIGLDVFRIRDLEKILSDKFDMIDRLYSNLFERQRIRAFEDIAKVHYHKEGKSDK